MAAARRNRKGTTVRGRPVSGTRRSGAVGTRRRGSVGTTRREGRVGTRSRAPVSGGGGRGIFVFLLMLIGVLGGGAAFALREDIGALLKGDGTSNGNSTDPVIAPIVKPPVEDPVVKPPIEDPIVEPPVEDPIIKPPNARDEGEALAAIGKGEAAFADGKFAPARALFGQVELMECKPETRKKAAALAKRCAAFVQLVGNLTISTMATEKTCRIKIRGRSAIEGFVEKLPDGSYKIIQTDGKSRVTFTLKATQVESVTPVSPEAKRQRLLTELKRRRGRVRDQTPVAVYDLAAFAWEHALRREAAAEFSRAYDLAEAKGQDLVSIVWNDQADRLLGHARWYETVGRVDMARPYCEDIIRFYPESKAGADAKALLRRLKDPAASRPKTFAVETDETKPETPKTNPDRPIRVADHSGRRPTRVKVRVESIKSATMGTELAKADAAFKTGMEAYMEGLRLHRDGGNFVPSMREARRYFGKALPLYQKAAEREPGNGRLQKRAQEIGFYYHQCGRMLPI